MKKKLLICASVVLGLIALTCVGNALLGHWLWAGQVDRATFRGVRSCDGPSSATVELTDGEIGWTAALFDLSLYAGDCLGEGCDTEFGFTLYMKDGTQLGIREAGSPRIQVMPQGAERSYWVYNPLLVLYTKILIAKYDLKV